MKISKIDFEAEVHAFKKYLTLTNYKPSTVSMYCRTLRLFYEFCNSRLGEEELSQDHAQEYLLTRVESGRSWATINCDYSALLKYYKELRDYRWSLRKMPRPKRDKKLPAILRSKPCYL